MNFKPGDLITLYSGFRRGAEWALWFKPWHGTIASSQGLENNDHCTSVFTHAIGVVLSVDRTYEPPSVMVVSGMSYGWTAAKYVRLLGT